MYKSIFCRLFNTLFFLPALFFPLLFHRGLCFSHFAFPHKVAFRWLCQRISQFLTVMFFPLPRYTISFTFWKYFLTQGIHYFILCLKGRNCRRKRKAYSLSHKMEATSKLVFFFDHCLKSASGKKSTLVFPFCTEKYHCMIQSAAGKPVLFHRLSAEFYFLVFRIILLKISSPGP